VVTGLAAVITLFTVLWLGSLAVRNSSIVDIWWGPAILLIGVTYFLAGGSATTRAWLTLALVALWALRLATHIGARNIGHGEDFRYAAWRAMNPETWWFRSYFKVFLLQGVIAWIVALPLYYAITAGVPVRLTTLDWAGLVLFAVGFSFEAAGDEQLRRFKKDPRSQGRVLDTGLWRYTRHPNYFGEAVLWWGLGLMGAAAPRGWLGLIGPAVITFLLVRVSGVAMLEKTLNSTKAGYADYIASTPAFWPGRPKRAPSFDKLAR
jgi:steroid 5-alpha reductase family enzyme